MRCNDCVYYQEEEDENTGLYDSVCILDHNNPKIMPVPSPTTGCDNGIAIGS